VSVINSLSANHTRLSPNALLRTTLRIDKKLSYVEKQRVILLTYAVRCSPIKWPFRVIQGHLFQGQ